MSGPRREADLPRRRTLVALALATAIGSAGLAAGGTAGALLGAEIAGTEAAAGLPLGLLVVGQAAAALLVSGTTGRAGRGLSLALGYVLGVIGLVAAGIGVSLVPACLQNLRRPRVAYKALDGPTIDFETAIVRRKDTLSPVMSEFLQVIG